MFVVIVLVVIAVGVGVLAATTSRTVYGPSWGRFTAAFPGPADGQSLGSPTVWSFFYEPSSNPSGGPQNHWTSYAPLSLPNDYFAVNVLDGHESLSQLQKEARSLGTALFRPHLAEGEQNGNGVFVIKVGPQCTNGECRAVDSSRTVEWFGCCRRFPNARAQESARASWPNSDRIISARACPGGC
jgi:hypothetical protein